MVIIPYKTGIFQVTLFSKQMSENRVIVCNTNKTKKKKSEILRHTCL